MRHILLFIAVLLIAAPAWSRSCSDEEFDGMTCHEAKNVAIKFTHCNAFYAPADEVQDDDDVKSVFRAPQALTITEIWCKTEGTGTPIVGFELINGGDQVNGDGAADYIDCPEAGISDSTLAGVTAMADGDVLDWDIESGGVSGTTVTGLTVCVEYTFD